MWNSPSTNGTKKYFETVLMETPIESEPQSNVTTQNPKPTTPSPRGHA